MDYLELKVSGGKDTGIQARYAENLIVKINWPIGKRDKIDGKYMVGIKDIFIPDGGKTGRLSQYTSVLSDTTGY